MTTNAQLIAIFAFGLLVTGIVLMGVMRAKELARRGVRSGADDRERR